MRRLSLCLVFLCLTLNMAHAQSDGSWPPHPDALFAPGVEVVTIEPVVDYEGRVLFLYEAGDWHAYPYPAELNMIIDLGVRPDGTWLIFDRTTQDPWQYYTWSLDPTTGIYSRIDPPCGMDRDLEESHRSIIPYVLNSGPLEKIWVYAADDGAVRLCSLLTERKSNPLPEHIRNSYARYELPLLPDISPNGHYAVFMTYKDEQNLADSYTLYSYNLFSDELLYLGEIYPDFGEDIGLNGWLDDEHFVIGVSMMPEWSQRKTYAGDASQANSVEFAANMLRFSPEGSRTSVEAMDAVMMDGESSGPCFLEYYDTLTYQHTLYDTGDLCEYGLRIADGSGDRLYRALVPSMTLVRFNLETGQRTPLFTGEIELIKSVSPGGSYAVLGLGKNGTVDLGQDPDGNANIDYYYETEEYLASIIGTYAVVDLVSGNLLGSFPDSAQWFSDDMFLVIPPEQTSQIVTIDHGVLRSADLPGIVQFSLPTRGQVLLQREDGSVDLYTVETGTATPLLKSMSDFAYTFCQETDDTICVQIARSTEPLSPKATYTIRLS